MAERYPFEVDLLASNAVDYNISGGSQVFRRGVERRGLGIVVVTSVSQIECSIVESLLLCTYYYLGIEFVVLYLR